MGSEFAFTSAERGTQAPGRPQTVASKDRETGLELADCPQKPSAGAIVKSSIWSLGPVGQGPSARLGGWRHQQRQGARELSTGGMPGRLWARGRGRWLRRGGEQIKALPCGMDGPTGCSLGVQDLLAAATPVSQAALQLGLRNGLIPEMGPVWAGQGYLGQPCAPLLGSCGSRGVSLPDLLTLSK